MNNTKIRSSGTSTRVKKHRNLVIHIVFIIACALSIYPFLVIVGSSFQSQEDIMSNGYSIFPAKVTFTAYKMILRDPTVLLRSYLVTIVTTVVGSVVGLWVITSYAYTISRKDFKYRKHFSFYVFFTMLFNGGMVPSYIMISKWLGLKNSILALILPSLISGWYVLLMKGFLQTIPDALIESAKIDGAGEVYTFIKIVLPISKPPLATIGLFLVLQYWNDWWLTLLYIDNENLMKLQYMLIRVLRNMEFLNSAEATQFGMVQEGMEVPTQSARMAMCVLAAGPMLLVFPFFQKYFVRGLTVGSVKG